METVPSLLSPSRDPRCFQEALCIASAKAMFSFGVTKSQRAARGTEHERTRWEVTSGSLKWLRSFSGRAELNTAPDGWVQKNHFFNILRDGNVPFNENYKGTTFGLF